MSLRLTTFFLLKNNAGNKYILEHEDLGRLLNHFVSSGCLLSQSYLRPLDNNISHLARGSSPLMAEQTYSICGLTNSISQPVLTNVSLNRE